MMDIERELQDALRRKSPHAGFAARVMARVADNSRLSFSSRAPAWRAVAAAVLFTAVLGGWTVHEISQRRQGERARDEVLLAFRITSEKLHEAQSRVVK
jgi:hypothetical protein